MSSKLYLPTRGKAIQSSWLNEVDHRLADVKFFADYTEGYSTVQLPKVNDSQYPPQRKSFSMLAYYHDHQIENYDWFIRMDDDSVLQWGNLNEFLDRDEKLCSTFLTSQITGACCLQRSQTVLPVQS